MPNTLQKKPFHSIWIEREKRKLNGVRAKGFLGVGWGGGYRESLCLDLTGETNGGKESGETV